MNIDTELDADNAVAALVEDKTNSILYLRVNAETGHIYTVLYGASETFFFAINDNPEDDFMQGEESQLDKIRDSIMTIGLNLILQDEETRMKAIEILTTK